MTLNCSRSGCGKAFDPNRNDAPDCVFHPGQPVFHEGLKSWSCCKDINKPVMEFDQFMRIKGCAAGTHSLESAVEPAKINGPSKQLNPHLTRTLDDSGKETYSSAAPCFGLRSAPREQATADVSASMRPQQAPKPKPPEPELEDDQEAIVSSGSECKRLGCHSRWTGPDAKRGVLQREECTFHPGTPIFHEGSKGYSCCKRRVLDFDDFLKIKGCKASSHLFVEKTATVSQGDLLVDCRFDFYQTPTSVIVSVFAKGAARDASVVKFESQAVVVDLKLPSNKRYMKRFLLCGAIDPLQSSYKILSTKCEIELLKADGRSWSNLEIGDAFVGTMTFGVGDKTGTIGSKHIAM